MDRYRWRHPLDRAAAVVVPARRPASATVTSGAGGLYGGGTGGAANISAGSGTKTSGKAGNGLIVIIYTPIAAATVGLNMAMMGM